SLTLGATYAIMDKLGGELDSTRVVNVMSKELTRLIFRAFGRGRRNRHARNQVDAPWWTTECAAAREAMFSQRVLMQSSGTLNDPEAKSVFSSLRTRYQRLRRQARESYHMKHFEDLLKKCKTTPVLFGGYWIRPLVGTVYLPMLTTGGYILRICTMKIIHVETVRQRQS
ncbi:hypothetical protein Vafri_7636, partial [Volvox africanus]